MENKEISKLLIHSMNNYQNLIKATNTDRYKKGKVLTKKQFFTLVEIQKREKIELKNLSKELYVSTSSLCILLNKLVELGYVYREEDSKDRRNTFYGITEEGEVVVNTEIEKFMQIVNDKIDKLDLQKKKELEESLQKTINIMKEII
ncbi:MULTISPECIES: MarR family winged helix-turn-helix transcriptional regulator [Paraclostridium]|uniref:MarR family transcriptional regulator n=1 Tax=Paraclostridium bifermentans TaxID=1490 RepID=A0A5P3XBM0_PARBF|nr:MULTISPECIES: MarR family winged helix-turn-helix transcriptional regulator [Paraclostridium]MDV8110378.1 MarR family winged helix-turn-helix transcriptional regulator [Bacillus sp. BAU-SS-2023]MCR1875174.1 MarR family winged helix-turn-helix transcriptional regulator [Paraclostridium bifermentans]MCU9810547.1 MarR family winged helix-turn-helix transcriptional regulator [Paraclostridium sp. AKS81]NME09490.1 winged helix-turn-helix transcriptional regulator [Paraclostridium bifermentans]QEZ